ncbi:MAG: hypothetical protein FWF87_01980 [Synergistaceae bacterium]|nr:hypothetical protein [Synergistaceae bacterium]
MKNFLVLMLVLVLALTFCAGAQATVQTFNGFAVHGFSLDVPAGWFASENKDSNKFDFNSPDGSITIARMGGAESITFLYASSEGLYEATFAEAIAGLMNGSDPVENGFGDFEFSYTKGGEKTNVLTRHISHLGIVMESKSGFDDILSILETLN